MDPYTRLPDVPLIQGRTDFLIQRSRNKRVLHLGCVDTGMLETRIQAGTLLHLQLAQVTADLWGFDINEEGIEVLRQHGVQNLVVGDVSCLDQYEALQHQTFDLILASEVVEHLQNPGLFFQSVQHLMTDETELVVTVPNAFRVSTLQWMLKGVEYVHPDHNYWFSYVTISNLLTKNDFTIKEFLVYTFGKHHLVPRSLGRFFGRGQEQSPSSARPAGGPGEASGAGSGPRRRGPGRLFSYVRQLPRRALLAWLFRKTPFWGDGLIVVAGVNRRPDAADPS